MSKERKLSILIESLRAYKVMDEQHEKAITDYGIKTTEVTGKKKKYKTVRKIITYIGLNSF